MKSQVSIDTKHTFLTRNDNHNEEAITLAIQGMYCAGCAARIENVLKKTEGIEDIKVNFATSSAFLKFDESKTDLSSIQEKIQKLGYEAKIREDRFVKERIQKIRDEKRKTFREWILFIFSLLFSLPLVLSMIFPISLSYWMQLFLAFPVQWIAGFRFHKGAFKTIRSGGANMDVLVSLGTNVAFFYSIFVMFWGDMYQLKHVYFESSSMVITFVLLGKILEGISRRRANQAIEDLFSLQPLTVHLWKDGTIMDVEVTQVGKGDIVIVRPGENIPADGIIIEGKSECNESLITGESLPITKKPGDKVFSGSTNISGMLKIRLLSSAEESTLSNILQMVESAQNSKAPVQKLADFISGYFAYGVITISILTFIISFFFLHIPLADAIVRSVAILVIACPCALGLATPIAILISTGIAAKYGILFRNAEAIEFAGKINRMIFDKTGTLTKGELSVRKFQFFDLQGNPISDPEIKEILSLIQIVEEASEHIIAHSIVQFIRKYELPKTSYELKNLENFPGFGVKGVVKDIKENQQYYVQVGNQEFYDSLSPLNQDKIRDFLSQENGKRYIQVYVYISDYCSGIFLLEDTLRKEAKGVIQILKSLSVEPILATGDKKEIANTIANELGIQKVYSEIKPEDKLQIIETFQKKKDLVGMIGDGLNDAPALAKADVSFAMGTGVSITKESSDVNLIHNDLYDVPFSIYLSIKTLRKIKQNLFFAFIYNIIGIPLAALGYLSPVFAGFAMAMSSVSVVSSSLFLYFVSREKFLKKYNNN